VSQSLRIPAEVVSVVDGTFDEFPMEMDAMKEYGGDIKVEWELTRPSYQKLKVGDYGGTYRLGRFLPPSGNMVAGIMGWRSEFRDSILAYGYDQYDISHALPTVIFHYFKDLNLPNLSKAIDELDAPTVPRRGVKDVVNRVLQGCNVTIGPDTLDAVQCEWYEGLLRESLKIHEAMQQRYPGFVSICKAKRRKEGKTEEGWPATAIQIFYNDVESVVQAASAAMVTGSLINCDALFVPKVVPGNILETLNDLHSDIGIKYVHKPMMQCTVIPNIDAALERVHGTEDDSNAGGVYGAWKAEFEKTNFYLREHDKFVTLNHHDRKMYFTYKTSMTESRYAYDADNVKAWISDPDRLTYNSIVNCPPPQVCGPKDFNLWGFSSSFRASTLPELLPGDDIETLVAPVLEMFKSIVSHNMEHYDYLINYMADSLQNPGIKRAQYIGMYGEQGVGKNELMERFWLDKIIGAQQCITYGSIEEWAGPYEDGWQNKTWVMVHETDYKDFTAKYPFLKKVTGSLHQNSNTKYGAKLQIAFYGRIIMLSNYINAFNEDNLISRRQGLRCTASSFRHVPNALEIMKDQKVQRAFYDYLMDYDTDGWDPEANRMDTDIMRDANFLTTFRKEQGNMMMVYMHLAIDKLYETYRKIDEGVDPPEYKKVFAFPKNAIYDGYYDFCGFETDGNKHKSGHITNMAALVSSLAPGNTQRLVSQVRTRTIWHKNGENVATPNFQVDYPAFKRAIADKMERYGVANHFDLDMARDQIVAKLGEYHQSKIDAGYEYQPSVVVTLQAPKTKSAHHNKPGESPKYIVRQGGDVVFGSDDPEEINRELGEAWIEGCEYDDGRAVQILHAYNKEIMLGSRYMRDYGTTMLELRFPFYVHNRAV
jgi:hypothetical protein